jgi:glycosyltransferase involved in cell wall biosynthesis
MDVSIVVPVYNEQESLLVTHKRIREVFDPLGYEYEIIYVNDGSTDNSLSIIMELQKMSEAKVIDFKKNTGQTSALAEGFRTAYGKYILTIDADLQYEVRDYLRILRELESCDMSIGYRKNRLKSDGILKFLSMKVSNLVRNIALNEKIKDAGCSFRGFRRESLRELKLWGDCQVFIPSLLLLQGKKIKQIPVKTYPRRYGQSKFNIRNRVVRALVDLQIVLRLKQQSNLVKDPLRR